MAILSIVFVTSLVKAQGISFSDSGIDQCNGIHLFRNNTISAAPRIEEVTEIPDIWEKDNLYGLASRRSYSTRSYEKRSHGQVASNFSLSIRPASTRDNE